MASGLPDSLEEIGCPVRKSVSSSVSADVIETTNTIESEFEKHASARTKKLFDELRSYSAKIEADIAVGNLDLLHKESLDFMLKEHELAIAKMTAAHQEDYTKKKDMLQALLSARTERKRAKREARISIRASKKRDLIIQQQEQAAHAAARIRESVNEKRAAFEALTQHMYDVHAKQVKNLIQAQERQSQNEKLLVDLETRHLSEELRSTLQKKFQVRQTHQGHLNKRINDNLREYQLLELRHAKEKFEFELFYFEEIESKKIVYDNKVAELKIEQMNELHAEKDKELLLHETEKETGLKANHARELRQLLQDQRQTLKHLKAHQDEKIQTKRSQRSHVGVRSNHSSAQRSSAGTGTSSMSQSRSTSVHSLPIPTKKQGRISVAREFEETEEPEEANTVKRESTLTKLRQRHDDALNNLLQTIRQELDECQLQFESHLDEMIEQQASAKAELLSNQERDVQELRRIQEKDIMMEESMHDSEMKMLVERRILNSVLETVADGIINITPSGVIVRFNSAAENMFGYQASEVIGINISHLMPERFGKDHHNYLNNYLTTGVKKVIGSGRRVFGLRKDGTEFPLHLSISELKVDDEHLFTGIARDLTDEVEEEARNLASDTLKQKELEQLAAQLDFAKENANNLLCQMLPESVSRKLLAGEKVPPQAFECASVMFLDVFGFGALSEQIPPLESVRLLNDLYRVIDHVIEKYDVYKVETVGDTYMIVSGVPKENRTHASEVATMALHLLHCIDQFVCESRPEIKIRVRIGINTGPVVAGVIGSKMPRYCLFGDTVNTASRMVTNGQAGKIHISESTFRKLKEDGGFELSNRGQIEVKGKGQMNTYWVENKQNFDPSRY